MIKLFIITTMIFVSFLPVYATDFRPFNPITSPNAKLPSGAMTVAKPMPVDVREVEKAVEKIMGSWNTPDMDNKLAGEFYNKDRLMDTVATGVPKDAKLRLLSVQGVQTLNQHIRKNDSGESLLVSMVSAIARTQVEYNDPTRGFQRLEGMNEYILKVTSELEVEAK
jgi:hypothetical protein